jgi:cysteine desulfurase
MSTFLSPCFIYLDNNATTQVAPEVFDAMRPFFGLQFGNPSSMHTCGGVVAKLVEEARGRIATLIGAEPTELVFTSGGTESDNFAIRGILDADPDKKHIVTTRVEHPAVLNTCRYLKRSGYEVTELEVDNDGNLDLERYRSSLRADTAVVSVMWANNETGVIFPIAEMARIARSRGIVFHTDAVQAVGKIPIDLSKLPVDLLSLSGHKLHGPKGIGALYIRRGTRIRPLIYGGHQERGRRPGTENVPGIVGLGHAARLALSHMEEENTRVRAMRDRLEKELISRIPRTRLNGNRDNRLPNTTNISFEFIEGEAILLRMNELRIAASSGSACTSGSLEPSHVLRAMGIPFTMIHGSVRFSFSRYNTDDQVDLVIEEFPKIVSNLRDISPYWKTEFAR